MAEKPPQTITEPPPWSTTCWTQSSWKRSPRRLHTRTRLSGLLKLNLDSSENNTRLHCCRVHLKWTADHALRAALWAGVCLGRLAATREASPAARRRLLTVSSLMITLFVTRRKLLMRFAVLIRDVTACLTMTRSVLASVERGLPDLCLSFTLPVARNL